MSVVAPLVGIVIAVSVVLGSWLVARSRAASRARRVRTRLGDARKRASLDEIAVGSVVSIEGTVRATDHHGRVTTLFPFGVSLSEKPSSEAVAIGGTRSDLAIDDVELAGPVQVVLGARETALRASKADAASFGVSSLPEEGMLRSVATGDAVMARGRLERIAGETSDHYRNASVRYRLVGTDASPIAIAAKTSPRRATKRHLAMPFVLGTFAGAAAAGLAWVAKPPPPTVVTTTVTLTGAQTSTPVRAPECAAKIDGLLAKGDPWSAKESLATCDWRTSQARIAVHLGELREASDAFAEARKRGEPVDATITEIEAHLFAGNNALARDVVKLLRAAHYPDGGPVGLSCVEGALGRRAGQADGAELLARTADRSQADAACSLLADDFGLVPYQARSQQREYFHAERAADSLGWSLQEKDRLDRRVGLFGLASVVVNDPTSRVPREVPLASAAVKALGPKLAPNTNYLHLLFTARSAADVALFDVVMGEREAAAKSFAPLDVLARWSTDAAYDARVAAYYDKKVGQDHEWPHLELARLLMSYSAGIALHAGDEPRMSTYLASSDHGAGQDALRRWIAQTQLGDHTKRLDHWNTVLDTAERGDGAEIAKELREKHSTGRALLPRLLPKVTKNRAALDTWLHDDFPAADLRSGVYSLALNIGDRRDAARVLGDEKAEGKWAAVAKRLHEVVLRRDGAPTWIALEETTAR